MKQSQVNVCGIRWHHVLDAATLWSNITILHEIMLHYVGLETDIKT